MGLIYDSIYILLVEKIFQNLWIPSFCNGIDKLIDPEFQIDQDILY